MYSALLHGWQQAYRRAKQHILDASKVRTLLNAKQTAARPDWKDELGLLVTIKYQQNNRYNQHTFRAPRGSETGDCKVVSFASVEWGSFANGFALARDSPNS